MTTADFATTGAQATKTGAAPARRRGRRDRRATVTATMPLIRARTPGGASDEAFVRKKFGTCARRDPVGRRRTATAQTVVPTPLQPRLSAGEGRVDRPACVLDGRRARDPRARRPWQSVRMTAFPLPGGDTVDLAARTRRPGSARHSATGSTARPAPGLADGSRPVGLDRVRRGCDPDRRPCWASATAACTAGCATGIGSGAPAVATGRHRGLEPSDGRDRARRRTRRARPRGLGRSAPSRAWCRPPTPTRAPPACRLVRRPTARRSEASVPGCTTWECRMAVETDEQLYALFNDIGAETAYLTTLLAAVSSRYQEQVDTLISFPYVQLYTTGTDPWITPDVGGDSIDMLIEFASAWAGNLPAGAQLGHFVSGARSRRRRRLPGRAVRHVADRELCRERQPARPDALPDRRRSAQLGLHGHRTRDRAQFRLAAHARLRAADGHLRLRKLHLRRHAHELLPPLPGRHVKRHDVLPRADRRRTS